MGGNEMLSIKTLYSQPSKLCKFLVDTMKYRPSIFPRYFKRVVSDGVFYELINFPFEKIEVELLDYFFDSLYSGNADNWVKLLFTIRYSKNEYLLKSSECFDILKEEKVVWDTVVELQSLGDYHAIFVLIELLSNMDLEEGLDKLLKKISGLDYQAKRDIDRLNKILNNAWNKEQWSILLTLMKKIRIGAGLCTALGKDKIEIRNHLFATNESKAFDIYYYILWDEIRNVKNTVEVFLHELGMVDESETKWSIQLKYVSKLFSEEGIEFRELVCFLKRLPTIPNIIERFEVLFEQAKILAIVFERDGYEKYCELVDALGDNHVFVNHMKRLNTYPITVSRNIDKKLCDSCCEKLLDLVNTNTFTTFKLLEMYCMSCFRFLVNLNDLIRGLVKINNDNIELFLGKALPLTIHFTECKPYGNGHEELYVSKGMWDDCLYETNSILTKEPVDLQHRYRLVVEKYSDYLDSERGNLYFNMLIDEESQVERVINILNYKSDKERLDDIFSILAAYKEKGYSSEKIEDLCVKIRKIKSLSVDLQIRLYMEIIGFLVKFPKDFLSYYMLLKTLNERRINIFANPIKKSQYFWNDYHLKSFRFVNSIFLNKWKNNMSNGFSEEQIRKIVYIYMNSHMQFTVPIRVLVGMLIHNNGDNVDLKKVFEGYYIQGLVTKDIKGTSYIMQRHLYRGELVNAKKIFLVNQEMLYGISSNVVLFSPIVNTFTGNVLVNEICDIDTLKNIVEQIVLTNSLNRVSELYDKEAIRINIKWGELLYKWCWMHRTDESFIEFPDIVCERKFAGRKETRDDVSYAILDDFPGFECKIINSNDCGVEHNFFSVLGFDYQQDMFICTYI